jgi:hypothetical protein
MKNKFIKKKINKKGFEMSFGMIFSIIAGAVIIFLAIYATTKLVTTSQYTLYSESAQAIGNLLNPVVNDISVATKAPEIDFKRETRIYLNCYVKDYLSPVFGRQSIAFSEESGFFEKWTAPGANISRYNKYIFGEKLQQGRKLNIFSKPFFAGYKVDDLVFLTMNDYCFIAAPEFIKDEIENLGLKNINVTAKSTQCSKNSIRVCFGFSGGCNITVYPDSASYESGRVTKDQGTIEYTGSLIYAAIFSSPEIYECNINRLGVKTSQLAKIYRDKIEIIKGKNCDSQIENNLDSIISITKNLTSSKLKILDSETKNMDTKNCMAECRIYASEDC